MKFTNPCKNCLIKPCCNIWCEEKLIFEKLIKRLSFYVDIIFIIISVIPTCFIVCFISKLNYSFNIRFLLILLVWNVSYLILVILVFKNALRDFKKGEKIQTITILAMILVIAPYIFTYLILTDIYEMLFGNHNSYKRV
jgi:hypothetical protein